MNITPEELNAIHGDYEKWVIRRSYEVGFSDYLAEQEMRTKAKLYDEWVAESDTGPTETGDSPRQATAHRAIESGNTL